jgi:hypothetical protein
MDTMTTTERLFDIDPDRARALAQSLHRKKEDFQVVRKSFAADKVEAVESEHAVVSYITTKSIDRDGEVLLPEGMVGSVYDKSGRPVFWGHQYGDPDFVIGQNIWYRPDANGNGIVAKTVFRNTEYADKVYRLYTEDQNGIGPVLKGWSVGFIPLEWEDGNGKKGGPRRTYTKWELLEYSTAPLQSNRDALSIAYQKGIITSDIMKKDMGVIDDAPAVEPEPVEPIIEYKLSDELRAATRAKVAAWKAEHPEPVPIADPILNAELKDAPDPAPEMKEAEAPAVTDAPIFDAPVVMAEAPEVKSEGQPIDVTLQLLTAVLAAVESLPATVAQALGDVRQDIAALRDSIPLLIVPSRPEVMGEMVDAPGLTLFELQAAVGEIKAAIVALATPPASANSDANAVTTPSPAPVPEPVKAMTPAEFKSAVADAVKGIDLGDIVKKQTTLALAKLRGRVE